MDVGIQGTTTILQTLPNRGDDDDDDREAVHSLLHAGDGSGGDERRAFHSNPPQQPMMKVLPTDIIAGGVIVSKNVESSKVSRIKRSLRVNVCR